jgi:diguanylate cyclase (GGDEF)-like protein/PAS domain S-box-containing protein
MIVVTRHQDHVEMLNKALRNAGHPVHLSWLPDASDLGDALTQIAPEMLIIFGDEGIIDLPAAMHFRGRLAPDVPVLIVRESIDERAIAAALGLGAQDAVSLRDLDRIVRVVARELAAHRLERALSGTVSSMREYKRQLHEFMQGSTDAIAQVQEGIIVEANPAWLELFGHESPETILGTPLMDSFDTESHAALKGALVACLRGKWSDHALRVSAALPDDTTIPIELHLAAGDHEGEPCVRVSVASDGRDRHEMEKKLAEAVQRDPSTGFLHRRYFLEELHKALAAPLRGGVRYFAYIEPDKYDSILEEVGVLTGEDFLVEFAQKLREHLQPSDIAGRFAGNGFMVLVHRGNDRDVVAWAEHVVRKAGGHVFQVGDNSLSTTCTVGLGQIPASLPDPSGPASDAFNANRRGRALGGNRVHTLEHTDTMLKLKALEKLWAKRIKSALMENRFRLVQQPIASLLGDERVMFDVLVRMLDEQGDEVLPSEFMPAAESNDLMKNIDRWVIGASMSFCASRRPGSLFVRLSKTSLSDPSLVAWLSNQLRTTRIDPAHIVFQVSEEAAGQRLREAAALHGKLKELGFQFAVEGFGSGRDTEALLAHLRPEFVKIHGSLIQGLATDQEKQARAKELVDMARAVQATTIAERVEDANTMAVLWQLGVEFIQGYFVNAPEDVVLG